MFRNVKVLKNLSRMTFNDDTTSCNGRAKQQNKNSPRLKSHYSLDIVKIILASMSFNSRHAQIYLKTCQTEIDLHSELMRDFLKKAPQRNHLIPLLSM